MKIAIITARGGSKRIPKKNIRNFCGKPIIAYSIEAAEKAKIFDEIMVSTDDVEIAEIAKNYGVNVPFMRSEKNSNDFASTLDVIIEVLDEYENRGMFFSECCCIYPTAPFITPARIRESFDKLGDADIVIPIVKYSFPPQRGLMLRGGKAQAVNASEMGKRSQDLEPIYHDCGQFYTMNVSRIREKKRLYTDNMLAIEIPEIEVQDIDNIEDWELAELKYQYIHRC